MKRDDDNEGCPGAMFYSKHALRAILSASYALLSICDHADDDNMIIDQLSGCACNGFVDHTGGGECRSKDTSGRSVDPKRSIIKVINHHYLEQVLVLHEHRELS